MKQLYTLFLALFISATSFGQTTLSSWSFDGITANTAAATFPSLTAGDFLANTGVLITGSEFTGLHTSTSTVWSTPAGNGSAKSLSSNNWGIGDYYQFKFSTLGYSGISILFEQTGSSTGPKEFKVQYSTDGSNFTDLPSSSYTLIASNWSTSSFNTGHSKTFDLTSIASLDNFATVYIRLVNTSTVSINNGIVAIAGTGRIDDFTVKASTTLSIGKDEIANFSLYPNPVKGGKVFINSANTYAERTVEVFDVLGKQVVSQKGTQNSIDVSHLNKGIYILKVAEEGKVATRKLIIE